MTLSNSDIQLITQIVKNIPPWYNYLITAIIVGTITFVSTMWAAKSNQTHSARTEERKRKIDELQQKKTDKEQVAWSNIFCGKYLL